MTPLVAAVWSCPPGRRDATTRRATCSSSSTTTACCRCSARRHGAPSSAGRPPTSRRSPAGSTKSRAGVPVSSGAAGTRRRADRRRQRRGRGSSTPPSSPPTPTRRCCMLAEPTAAERTVLGAMPYSTNHAQLHTDESVLPRHTRARASWNYLVTPDRDNEVLVTYDVTPADAAVGPDALPGHPRRPRPRRPGDRAGRDDLPPPALHTGIRCRATTVCRHWTTTGWCSPARTTAGDSTRTAPHRDCAPRNASAGPLAAAGSRCQDDRTVLTPAIYRTRITHLRRAPVHHYFEHRGYSWYVDIDDLPQLPRWLRPFARFDARDHFDRRRRTTRCGNGSTPSWPSTASTLPGGTHHRAAAGQGARLRVQPAEPVLVPRRRRRAAARSSPRCTTPTAAAPRLSAAAGRRSARDGRRRGSTCHRSTTSTATTWCGRRGPTPTLDVTISLHRDNQPAFVATMRGDGCGRGIGSARSAADRRAGGTADGCAADPRPGHHALASPGAVVPRPVAEKERVDQL